MTVAGAHRVQYDVVIVGGGPAGLSAALVLARCRRRVVICDAGRPRNRWSHAVHNLLGNDRIGPSTLLRRGRQQVRRYGGELCRGAVIAATRRGAGFEARLADGRRLRGRILLLATGIRDAAPPLPGLARWKGSGVYYCAYCDAYEVRDQPLIALGHGRAGAELALALTTWSAEVTFCTNGNRRPAARICAQLQAARIAVHGAPIVALRGTRRLEAVELRDGTRLPCRGLFIHEGYAQQSDLARRLGCVLTRRGAVRTDRSGRSSVPGVYVAGDASEEDAFAVVVAAASGARAAFAINTALRRRHRALR